VGKRRTSDEFILGSLEEGFNALPITAQMENSPSYLGHTLVGDFEVRELVAGNELQSVD
jgi:hypothetical protein